MASRARDELPSSGQFQCPKCWQRYDVPQVPIGAIRQHLRKHGLVHDTRWVQRRLKQEEKK